MASVALGSDESSADAKAAATIILGALFKSVQPADDGVNSNAQDGHLQALLNSTLLNDADEVAARAMTLLLLVDHQISTPDGTSWKDIVAKLPELPGMLDSLLQQWKESAFFHLLINQLDRDPDLLPVIKPLMISAIRRGDIGELNLEDVFSDPNEYTKHLDTDDTAAFVDLLPR